MKTPAKKKTTQSPPILTGTQHVLATRGMVRCTGAIECWTWVTAGPRPRGRIRLRTVQVSRVIWDSTMQGTYVRPENRGQPGVYEGFNGRTKEPSENV
jgi:hypothetical protein